MAAKGEEECKGLESRKEGMGTREEGALSFVHGELTKGLGNRAGSEGVELVPHLCCKGHQGVGHKAEVPLSSLALLWGSMVREAIRGGTGKEVIR